MDGWAIDLTRRSWKNFGRKRINRSLVSRIRKKQRSNRRREIGREEHSQFKHRTHTNVLQPNAWPCYARTLRDGLSAPNEADKLICWRTREEGRNTRQLGECRRKRGRGGARRRVGKPRCEFLPLRPQSVSQYGRGRTRRRRKTKRRPRCRTARINNAAAAVVPRQP